MKTNDKNKVQKIELSAHEKDVESFIEFIDTYTAKIIANKELSISFLKEVGILNKKGNISKYYRKHLCIQTNQE
jgi:hypothetical protein